MRARPNNASWLCDSFLFGGVSIAVLAGFCYFADITCIVLGSLFWGAILWKSIERLIRYLRDRHERRPPPPTTLPIGIPIGPRTPFPLSAHALPPRMREEADTKTGRR
jgi:hypothetical protein